MSISLISINVSPATLNEIGSLNHKYTIKGNPILIVISKILDPRTLDNASS